MMSTLDAIALAQYIKTQTDEYEIAKILLHLEYEAEKRGVSEMAGDVREILKGEPTSV